ncbi:MAG: STAS/SEC14 domain-containing protein [Haloarculaceae archaeon]
MVEDLYVNEGMCRVTWAEPETTIEIVWEGDVDGERFRESADAVLSILRETDASKILVDGRAQGFMDESDQIWIVEDWEPRAVEAGLESMALVYPEDLAARTTVDMSARRSRDLPLDRVFTDDADEARDWLRVQ